MSDQRDLINLEAKVADAKKQKGASLVEYALLAALIAVVCIVAMKALGNRISTQFSTIASSV